LKGELDSGGSQVYGLHAAIIESPAEVLIAPEENRYILKSRDILRQKKFPQKDVVI
jgi:hypothetical protein